MELSNETLIKIVRYQRAALALQTSAAVEVYNEWKAARVALATCPEPKIRECLSEKKQ